MIRIGPRFLVSAFLAAALAGAASGAWTVERPGAIAGSAAQGGPVSILVLDNGFHTDLAIPRAALEARPGPLGEAVRTLAPGDWVLVGWGDARFYVDQSPIHHRLPDGARAFFWPGNASVVMLDPFQGDPARDLKLEGAEGLALSPGAFESMAARIEGSLALTDGRPRVAAVRPGDDARFLASTETFWVGHLCNHWAAEILNAAGLPIRPFRAIASAEVMATAARAGVDSVSQAD